MSQVVLVKLFGYISQISLDAASNLDEAKNEADSIRNRYRSGADLQGLAEELNALALTVSKAMVFGRERLISALATVVCVSRVTIEDPDGRVERLRQPTELPICELLGREELGAVRSRAMRRRIMDAFYTPGELQIREVKRFLEGRDIETIASAGDKIVALWIKAEKLLTCSIHVRKDLEEVAGDDEDRGDRAVQLLETGMENLATVATSVANEAATTCQVVMDALSVPYA